MLVTEVKSFLLRGGPGPALWRFTKDSAERPDRSGTGRSGNAPALSGPWAYLAGAPVGPLPFTAWFPRP